MQLENRTVRRESYSSALRYWQLNSSPSHQKPASRQHVPGQLDDGIDAAAAPLRLIGNEVFLLSQTRFRY